MLTSLKIIKQTNHQKSPDITKIRLKSDDRSIISYTALGIRFKYSFVNIAIQNLTNNQRSIKFLLENWNCKITQLAVTSHPLIFGDMRTSYPAQQSGNPVSYPMVLLKHVVVLCSRESVDDIYADVYSEHFYMERALLPIFRVYKLKGISKKLAVMLSTAKDPNSGRWNRLFDLCQEVRQWVYVRKISILPHYYKYIYINIIWVILHSNVVPLECSIFIIIVYRISSRAR